MRMTSSLRWRPADCHPADKEVAKEAGDTPLRGVVVEKSMEESLVRELIRQMRTAPRIRWSGANFPRRLPKQPLRLERSTLVLE